MNSVFCVLYFVLSILYFVKRSSPARPPAPTRRRLLCVEIWQFQFCWGKGQKHGKKKTQNIKNYTFKWFLGVGNYASMDANREKIAHANYEIRSASKFWPNLDIKIEFLKNRVFSMYFVSISMYLACFKGLVCMGMTLNIIFEGYTSYSIIWNHIKSYLNHIQKWLFR